MGRNPEEPAAVALPFWRTGHGALVAGRERIYLDRFWNEFSATPSRFAEASREHYAELYALPGAMRAGFAQFAAFDQDALDNKAFLATEGKLDMPVLAIGGEKSFGPMMATVMRFAANDVTEGVDPRLWPLDHGGESKGDDRNGPCLPYLKLNDIILEVAKATVIGRDAAR